MKTITIRNVPDEDYRALRVRAAQNGRSMEAELRALIERAKIEPLAASSPRPPRDQVQAATRKLQARFARVFPKREPWGHVDEFIAERRAEAAKESYEP